MSDGVAGGTWVTDRNVALLTDQYQLTMVQAYWRENMLADAVFSLFIRRLPEHRNFILACGLDDALASLEALRFDDAALDYLAGRPEFERDFVDWLADLHFSGEVRAVREGTPLFPNEPILEVRAPLPEAQLAETILMNQIQLQTMLASKGARVVLAARGTPVVDFGLRRMHGADAGLKAARAFHIAGVAATSNVLAGKVYGVPVTGTMAHSYVQAHASELEAFRAFASQYAGTTLLVDTYDTLDGVRAVVRLAEEMGDAFHVGAVRLDSGDLAALAAEARRILDEAGLENVRIFASGGLDEWQIDDLRRHDVPIDGFGVGTSMGVSADAPSLDIAYKLTEYAGHGRLKLSKDKPTLPGPKQVFRIEEDGVAVADTIAGAGEELPGRALLEAVMSGGRRLKAGRIGLEEARRYAAAQIDALPARLRSIEPANPPYDVAVSPALRALHERVAERVERSVGA